MMLYCFSVLGQPVTKKRARTGVGVSKDGNAFRWATTPDTWYEEMIANAFSIAYPDAEPSGCELAYQTPKGSWKLNKNVSDNDLPALHMIMLFYFSSGKVGDLDNYIKVVKDALNGLAYIDDRQVKYYDPFVIEYDNEEEFKKQDEVWLSGEPCLERVDIIIRQLNHWPKRLFGIRDFISRNSKVIDLTVEYIDNNYREWRIKDLQAEVDERGIIYPDDRRVLKQEFIDLLIEYDKKEKADGEKEDGK